MNYQLIIQKKAQKDLKKIELHFKLRIAGALEHIQEDPFSGKALLGEYKGLWAYRVWPYRIIYKIERNILQILVVRIGHRQGVY